MITIRFAGWISGRIVSLQPDRDIQKLHSNGNRIRIRISETLLSIFRGFRLLEKVSHCTIIHLLFSEASFLPAVPWLQVCLRRGFPTGGTRTPKGYEIEHQGFTKILGSLSSSYISYRAIYISKILGGTKNALTWQRVTSSKKGWEPLV